jgi:hypothetical protein
VTGRGGLPACPRCGATIATPVGLNYVECGGTIEVEHQVTEKVVRQVGFRPVNGHPAFGMAPVMGLVTVTRTELRPERCAVRHHVAMEPDRVLLSCPCGTFAIGHCASCGGPVCGDDSERVSGKRLCSRCAAAANEMVRVAAEEERSRSRTTAASARPSSMPGGERSGCDHPPSSKAPDGHCWVCDPKT